MRGKPYSAHWFLWHGPEGAIDTSATYTMAGLPRSDVELAGCVRGMSEEAGSPILYGKQTGRWYVWDGSGRYAAQKVNFAESMSLYLARWLREAMTDAWEAVMDDIRQLPEGRREAIMKRAEENWKPFRAFTMRLWGDGGQRAARSVMADVLSVDESDMDAGTGRIIVDNGVIRLSQVLRDGYVALEPHDSSVLASRRMGAGVRWEPHAQAPAFERFLAQAVPDGDQRAWLCWRLACTLFGSMPRKGFLNLIGETDSGKSTLTELIARLAGDYAKTVPVDTFLSRHGGNSGFLQHDVMGARFLYTHEPNEGAVYDVTFMKTLTGRDRMRTAGKYEKPIEWSPQCTPYIGSNNPIRFSTADKAMMSRQEAIEFIRGYDVADPWLAERLHAELPGILRILLDHVVWQSQLGHVPELPLSIVALRERMASLTEDALGFVDEWLEEGRLRESKELPDYRFVQVNALYGWYRDWCEGAGTRPIGRKTFSGVIGRRYPLRRSNGMRFGGLEAL